MEPNPADAWEPFHISGSGQAGTRELESWLDVHWRWEMNPPIQAYPEDVPAMPEFELPARDAAVDHAPTPYAYSSGTNVAPGASPPRPYPQVRWTDLWLKRSAPAGTPENTALPSEEVRRTYLLLAEENGTRWTATATFVIPAGETLSTTVELAGDEIPGDIVQNSAGTLRLRPALLDGVERTVELSVAEFRAREGRTNDGFDPPLNGDRDADDVLDDEDWVPSTRVVSTNHLPGGNGVHHINELVEFFTNAPAGLELHVPADSQDLIDVEPKRIVDSVTPITISSKAQVLDRWKAARIIARPAGSDAEDGVAELRVYVFPELDALRLRFYVADDPVTPATDVQMPNIAAAQSAIIHECKARFGQAGIETAADPNGGLFQADLAWYYQETVQDAGGFDVPGEVLPTWRCDYRKLLSRIASLPIAPNPPQPLGGDIPVLFVHELEGGLPFAHFLVEASAVVMNIDAWLYAPDGIALPPWTGYTSHEYSAPYPYDAVYQFNQSDDWSVDDQLGRNSTYPRVGAHEVGHRLLIAPLAPSRDCSPNPGAVVGFLRDGRPWRGGHDCGPVPEGTAHLMNPRSDNGPPITGKWLRREDWENAFDEYSLIIENR
jgi:hypothetical protein